MKLKLTIALVVLALVLGMVLIACDDGDLPTIDPSERDAIFDVYYVTHLNKHGYIQNSLEDTTGFEAPDINQLFGDDDDDDDDDTP